MSLFESDCPRCNSPQVHESAAGRLRVLARVVFLYPLRCDACRHRFWRFRWAPPPVESGAGWA